MPTEIVLQTGAQPGKMLTALDSIATPDTTSLQVAVAFATKAGVELVFAHLRQQIGVTWEQIPKQMVVALDFGFTQPAALRALVEVPLLALRVADIAVLTRPFFAPIVPFHSKLYVIHRAANAHALVGSANLSAPAFSISTEAAAVVREYSEMIALQASWNEVWQRAYPVTDELISDYENRWTSSPPPIRPDETLPSAPPFSGPFQHLWAAIEGGVNPTGFENFWVDAGSMSSSAAHNQLELPRGSNWFFGFDFSDYQHGESVEAIGMPVLEARGLTWSDRRLKWHSSNMMERLNLPTLSQGGYDYAECIILFSRRPNGSFRIQVVPAASAPAQGWEANSRVSQTLFAVGPTSARRCGFF